MAEYNAADRKHIRAAEKAAAIAERQHAEVVVEMMATPQRRRYIWEKLAEAHVFSVPFYSDSGQMYFSEGERNAGTKLLADIMECCPEQFILAMREHNERITTKQEALEPPEINKEAFLKENDYENHVE